ncbi:phospholipase D-like protein [Cellulomonas sp. PhB143]|nr:phospholipase D-like protein [Cellulomonas sp. PhB143]
MLFVLVLVGLAVYALADCADSDEQQRGGIPKGLWYVLIVVLPLFGPLAWIVSRRSRSARVAGPGYPASGTPGTRPGGRRPRRGGRPVAPDDDPDFLWKLDQERRRRAQGGDEASGTPGPEGPADPGDDDAPQDPGAEPR